MEWGVVQGKAVNVCFLLQCSSCGFISKALVFLMLLSRNAASLLASYQQQTNFFIREVVRVHALE